jgi:hypothetical protein
MIVVINVIFSTLSQPAGQQKISKRRFYKWEHMWSFQKAKSVKKTNLRNDNTVPKNVNYIFTKWIYNKDRGRKTHTYNFLYI